MTFAFTTRLLLVLAAIIAAILVNVIRKACPGTKLWGTKKVYDFGYRGTTTGLTFPDKDLTVAVSSNPHSIMHEYKPSHWRLYRNSPYASRKS